MFTIAGQIYETFSAGVHTNLSLEDAVKLAVLAKDIPIAPFGRRYDRTTYP